MKTTYGALLFVMVVTFAIIDQTKSAYIPMKPSASQNGEI